MAAAPSEIGGTSSSLIGQASGLEFMTSSTVTSFFTCAYGFLMAFLRFFDRDHRGGLLGVAERLHARAPVCGREPHDADCEFAAPEGIVERRDRILQRAFGELVVGDDQDAIGEAARDLIVACQSAPARPVPPPLVTRTTGFSAAADRVDYPFLRLVDSGEQHRPGRDDDGVDVVDRELRIGERPVDRLAHQALPG